jgi:hypothetical protein
MKKLAFCILAAFLLLIFLPAQSNAATKTSKLSAVSVKTSESAQASVLLLRLDKIKAMDMTTLNSAERKALRKEVRSIKSQLSEMGGGVYLSVGAIILIIILLLLLL